MLFGIIGRMVPGMRHLVEFRDRSTGRGTIGGAFRARQCNHWELTFAATRPFSQITFADLLIFDTRAFWRSVLSARMPECQKLKMVC